MDDPSTTLLAANQAFYDAFLRRDLAAMDALWARQHPVACIHPGWPALLNRAAIMQSWRQILSSPGAPTIRCAEPTAHLLGDAAFVVCYELLGDARLVATNVFAREDQAWRLVHHQAGPTPAVAGTDDPATTPPPGRRLH